MFRSKSAFILCILLLAAGDAVDAQSFASLESTLRDHPSLQVFDFEATAWSDLAVSATGLPDPVISVGFNNVPVSDPAFDTFLPTNKSLGIRQQLPNRAGRIAEQGKAKAMATESLQLREQRFAYLRAELIVLLQAQYRIERERELAVERRRKYDELTQVAESEIDAGRPALFRLPEIEGERAEVDRLLSELNRQAAEVEAGLINLVAIVPESRALPVAPLSWGGDVTAFHAVQVASADVDVHKHDIDKAKAALRPEWGVQLTYQQREAGENFTGDDWVSGMVTFSVPLWAGRQQTPKIRAAQARQSSARANYRAAARAALARYNSFDAMRLASIRNVDILQQKIVAIEDKVAAQATIYESGVGDYAPVIDGEIAILTLRASIAAEEARVATSTARMNALLVTP